MKKRTNVMVVAGALIALALLVVLGAVLAGMTGVAPRFADQGTTGVPQPAVEEYGVGDASMGSAPSEAAPVAPDAVASDRQSAVTPQPLVIRTSSVEVRVDDVDEALATLRPVVARTGGEITNLVVTSGGTGGVPLPAQTFDETTAQGPASAVVTIRVPADELTAMEGAAAALGTVLSQSSSADDVTEQAIDLEARLKNLRAEEVRLRTFLNRTNKVSELLDVERELARVRGEIESMDAQLTYLERQAARATLTVTLLEPAPVVAGGGAWGLREALARGVTLAGALVRTIVTAAVPLALIAALAFAIIWPIRAVARRHAARHEADTTPEDV